MSAVFLCGRIDNQWLEEWRIHISVNTNATVLCLGEALLCHHLYCSYHNTFTDKLRYLIYYVFNLA